ncbi:copper chaperone PCu(A)C [Thioalkalivibrio sulfidiphilus]|uniref:copper chaperone PCu(A)C n=1 Tax=Thioalkalivibrio sulfidiphilus TaxID=1033854 RepID=UPI0003605C12|nr:copper chaperone PCu(A)C [Thioalkalivibrio sulfidiphilus]
MKNLFISLLLASLAFASPVFAHHAVCDVEVVGEPWVRSTPPNMKITAGYMSLRNISDTDRRLVAAHSPVSGRVELHTHVHDMQTGMMQMRHVEHIDLPAGQTVALEPGGLHIMLMDLNTDLQPGTDVPLTLEFDDGSTLEIMAPVRRMTMGGHHQGHGQHQQHNHHRH